MERQNIIFSDNLGHAVAQAVGNVDFDRLFILTDDTTRRLCLPLVTGFEVLSGALLISIPSGDENKTMDSVAHVWNELQRYGATRHSLMVCLGGGMVTDLGGFAASTFKRGINLINIPTTLLSMVDASVGGKTGVNYGGLKNEIGVFRTASAVIIDTVFLETMDQENILSGYAEMLKHSLISPHDKANSMWAELLTFDIEHPDLSVLNRMVAESVAVKQHIVLKDPLEQNLRKALNLGHTVGHAFESFALSRPRADIHPVLHGYAVAWGLVCELYLSAIKCAFPTSVLHQTARFIFEHYGRMPITCDDYPTLLQLMTHDKKNVAGIINFTLLSGLGQINIDQTATSSEIEAALDFYREG